LNKTAWATEVDTYLAFYKVNTIISEPKPVTELVASLQVNIGFYIWWDERVAQVELKVVRGIDAALPILTEEDHIIASSFKLMEQPTERISQAWVYYDHRNFVDSLDEEINYKQWSVFANLESETEELYGEPSIKKVFGYWLSSGALADTTASKLITRYVDVPMHCEFELDAKDRTYWTGDTVQISHHAVVDEFGERLLKNWTIISAEETIHGEKARYLAEDTTLYGRIHYVMADAAADYPGPASQPFKNCYIGDANGLLSDGTPCGKVS